MATPKDVYDDLVPENSLATQTDVNNEFICENNQSDLTLLVEGHRIPVSRSVLCIASPVFRAMLEGEFQEKSQSEIPLTGKIYEDFVEFLRCIYPDRLKKVTEKNAYQLLPLAHEYQMKKIHQRCEKVLVKTVRDNHTNDVEQLYRHIKMAETFTLDDLKEICIYIVSEHKLDEFDKAQEIYHISDISHLKVIKLALRRRELNLDDDKHFSLNINGKDITTTVTTSSCFSFGLSPGFATQSNMKVTLTGYVKEVNNGAKGSLRALRLANRFNITQDNIQIKILEQLKQRDDWPEEMKEEFKLLPEEIKKIVQSNK